MKYALDRQKDSKTDFNLEIKDNKNTNNIIILI